MTDIRLIIHALVMNKFGHVVPDLRKSFQVVQFSQSSLLPQSQSVALTEEGDFTIKNHRLRNVHSPIEDSDASTKSYVDKSIIELHRILTTLSTQLIKDIQNLKKQSALNVQFKTEVDKLSANDKILNDAIEALSQKHDSHVDKERVDMSLTMMELKRTNSELENIYKILKKKPLQSIAI